MTVYMVRQLRIQASEEQSGQNLIFRRGDKEIKFNAEAVLNEAGLDKLSITIPTVDKDLMEGQEIATGRMLYIETDSEIRVKLDDTTDTGFLVKPISSDDASTKPGSLYLEGEFTHVYVTTIGASGTAKIIFAVAGA